jgi:hypothetical protein
MKKIVLTMVLLFGSSLAQADQCQWNGRHTSQTARSVMAQRDMIVVFCQNCGDETYKSYMIDSDNKKTKDGKDIHFSSKGNKYWEFEINKSSKTEKSTKLDLAYTYILMGDHNSGRKLVNVGHLVNGCNPQGASPILDWIPGKTECMSNDGSCG